MLKSANLFPNYIWPRSISVSKYIKSRATKHKILLKNVFPNYIYDGRAQSRGANMGFCHTSGHKQPPWHDSRSHHSVMTSFRISWGWWSRILTQDQDDLCQCFKIYGVEEVNWLSNVAKAEEEKTSKWFGPKHGVPFISFAHVRLVKVTSAQVKIWQ